MEPKKSKTLKSTRPISAGKNTMEVIAPRQSTTESQRSRKTPTRKLERVSSGSTSPSTSLTDFSSIRPSTLDSTERSRLELLATNPLKSSTSIKELSQRSQELQEMLREKEEQMKQIQSIVSQMQEKSELFEEEESYEQVMDAWRDINDEGREKARQKRIKEIEDFTESLKNQRDEEGNKIVEFPEDYEEILQTATDHAVLAKEANQEEENVNWIQVYQAKHAKEKEDTKYRQKMERIKQLDLVIAEKEKQLRDIRSRDSESDRRSVDSKESVFITRPGAKSQAHSVSSISTRAQPKDKILKNIEAASNYKGHYSLIDRLGNSDKTKLDRLLQEADSKAIQEYTGIISNDTSKRLEEIDAALRNMVPQSDWESRSISNGASSSEISSKKSSTASKKSKAKPAEPAILEEQERRNDYQRIKEINKSLAELNMRPQRALTEEELQSLVLDATLSIESSNREIQKAILYDNSSMMDEAKEIIKKLENLESLDVGQLNNLLGDAENAVEKYEKAVELQEKVIENEPQFVKARQTLEQFMKECDEKKVELEDALEKLNKMDSQIQKELRACQDSEELEKLAENEKIYIPEDKQLSVEEIDQEIEAKVMNNYNQPQSSFSDLADINPENYPTLYYMYERVLQEPDGDKLINQVTNNDEFRNNEEKNDEE
ncbi:unnamed protein product [Blepharisma stoltei]|uniref:Uncharacterized protein n=1 Tax=Blepharisma stoltei TaxID=1481888 RepID=A0AAU9ITD7_9CILI|nr:unnamed protein product [Blepharisma stoltei]